MRRTLSCVLMMTLLLCGCAPGGGREAPENLAARIRGEYLSLGGWTAAADIHVDYGERVYDFTVDARWQRDGDTVLTVTAPELVAGITARMGKDGGYLEYGGMSLSTGPLTGDGLGPLEALPLLMEQLKGGYMARCSYETVGERELLKVFCRDPDLREGEGLGCELWFDPDSHDLLRAELSRDGFTILTAGFINFTKELMTNGPTDHADLG